MPPSGSRQRTDRRQRAERAGRRAEHLAAWVLRLKGYRILKARYKTPVGEIDLIARRGKVIVFVEVKHRMRGDEQAMGEAFEAVNTARIVRAAQWFLSQKPAFAGFDFRFDVIGIAPGRWPVHVANAFSA